MKGTRKRLKRHWYKVVYEECVLCGSSYHWRERVYGKRPKDRGKRVCYKQYLCCNEY